MSVPTLPDVFRQLACLAEIRGAREAPALRTAVVTLDRLSPDAISRILQHAGAASTDLLHDFSNDALDRLREVAAHGSAPTLAAARARIPSLLRRLLEAGVVTHDQAALLAGQFGIVTLADLRHALQTDHLAHGLGTSLQRLRTAADELDHYFPPVHLGRAHDLLSSARGIIAAHAPALEDVELAGDARRFEPLVEALVMVGRAADPPAAIDALASSPGIEAVLHRTRRRALVVVQQSEIDVRIAADDDYGTVLFAATGPATHVSTIHGRRHRTELAARETDIYAHAGLAWIPPELRHGTGEIEAAAAGRLPRLVERGDIRGDLHMHSTYSDGQDTIETMVAAAVRLGYEYVAITDHSPSAQASRTLSLDQLPRQRDEIERLRIAMPQITILHGLEVDILPDGTLDCPDYVLERLDIVLASLHDAAGHDGAALTERCLRAIRHPLVNVITHPANRLVGRRGGYAMDYDAVYQAAAETGTALEIDGAPSHLDLDGEQARAAVAAGVTVTVDSDCHRARALDLQMHLGVGTARRGWVGPEHVLNTRPLAAVRAFVAAKRSGC